MEQIIIFINIQTCSIYIDIIQEGFPPSFRWWMFDMAGRPRPSSGLIDEQKNDKCVPM